MRWDWIMARAEWFTFQSAGNVYSGSWWQGSTKAAVIMSLTQLHLTNEWRHRDLPWPRWHAQHHNPNVTWDTAVKSPKAFLWIRFFFFCNFNLFSFINSMSHAHVCSLCTHIVRECCWVMAACCYPHRCTNRCPCFQKVMFAACSLKHASVGCTYRKRACTSVIFWFSTFIVHLYRTLDV